MSGKPDDERAGSKELSGKLPWFDIHGNPTRPYMIGVTGGSASGKTSVSERVIEILNQKYVSLLSMDSFYKCIFHD